MKHVGLITDHPEKAEILVKCISILFPECDIELIPRNQEKDRCVPDTAATDPAVKACE